MDVLVIIRKVCNRSMFPGRISTKSTCVVVTFISSLCGVLHNISSSAIFSSRSFSKCKKKGSKTRQWFKVWLRCLEHVCWLLMQANMSSVIDSWQTMEHSSLSLSLCWWNNKTRKKIEDQKTMECLFWNKQKRLQTSLATPWFHCLTNNWNFSTFEKYKWHLEISQRCPY